jgi:hypothetical protein
LKIVAECFISNTEDVKWRNERFKDEFLNFKYTVRIMEDSDVDWRKIIGLPVRKQPYYFPLGKK